MTKHTPTPNASMTPGSRPRRGLITAVSLIAGGALVAVATLAATEADSKPAGAVALSTFASCGELERFGAEALDEPDTEGFVDEVGGLPGDDVMAAPNAVAGDGAANESSSQASSGSAREDAAEATTAATAPAEDGTNVAVEGVDEIDLVDRLTDDIVLVSSAQKLSLVDLAAGEVRATVPTSWDAQITYDAEGGIVWVVGNDEQGGVSVDRYAVTLDDLTAEGTWTTTGMLVDARRVGDELYLVATEGFPYAGDGFDGPVPMPEGPIDQPGSARSEDDVVEPGDDGVAATSMAVPFADGPVPCDQVLYPQTDVVDPAATLIVALPAEGAVEPVRASEVVGSGQLVHLTTGAAYIATPSWGEGGQVTGIHRFELDTLTPTGSGTVSGGLLDDFSMSEHDGVLRVATTDQGMGWGRPVPVDGVSLGGGFVGDDMVAAPEPDGAVLNEVVVLDTEGALDVIGRTPRFGKPGETIHGIRFAGTTGYAVTFMTTDPFYVLDLSVPTDPKVVGEVELPGFSSYLHPISDGLVVGFGPDESGQASAKLFDVSDPTSPQVVGNLVLGDESAITYDHHAYVGLDGGRFAVPANSWSGEGTTAGIVIVDTAGGQLAEVDRLSASEDGYTALRAIPTSEAWALLTDTRIVLFDTDGSIRGRITL